MAARVEHAEHRDRPGAPLRLRRRCAACSSTAPTPIRRCTPRRRSSTRRDRALAMRLAYGAVQRRGTLDHLIEQLAERPLERLDAPRAGGAAARAVRAALPARLARLRGRRRRGRARQGAGARAATASSTRCCAAPRARARAAARGAARRRRPSRRPSSTPHPRVDRARCGGRRSAPSEARALMACDNEPGELALRANTLVTDAADARRASWPRARRTATRDASRRRWCWRSPFDVHGSPLWRGARSSRSRARRCSSRARSTRARRAGARPVRRARRQEHPPRRADGRRAARWSPSSATARRAGALARTAQRLHAGERPRRGRRRGARPAASAARSTACSSIRPARGSARCRRAPDLRWRVTPEPVAADGARAGARSSLPAPRPSVRGACLSTLRARSPRLRTSA